MRDFLTLTLGHDLLLVARQPEHQRMRLLAVTAADPEKVLGDLGTCPDGGPSDGMLTIAAEQATRMFPGHARAIPPAEEKWAAPHVFSRDRSKEGFVCNCGQPANTPVHGR